VSDDFVKAFEAKGTVVPILRRHRLVSLAIAELSPAEKSAIDSLFSGDSPQAVAKALGITKSRLRRITDHALVKLWEMLREPATPEP
jgi:DNA-directed RNA polymerase specialized sigma subunit